MLTHRDADQLRRWCDGAYLNEVNIRTARGVRKFLDVAQPYQLEFLGAVAPSMNALMRGEMPEQRKFHIERTKKASKDTDIAIEIARVVACSPIELEIHVAAEDQEQAGEPVKRVRRLQQVNPLLGKLLKVHRNTISNPETGTTVSVLTSDTASSHGSIPDILVCNELSHIAGDTGHEFIQTLWDNAAGLPSNVLIHATNAGFLDSWQWHEREHARTSPVWWFQKVDRPAPWITETDLAEAERRNSPSRFARLYRGEWVDVVESPMLARPLIEQCQDAKTLWQGDPWERKPEPSALYMGVDFGRTKNRTVIWIDEKIDGVVWTRRVLVLHKTPFDEQERIIRQELRGVRACRLDKGAQGWTTVENLERDYPTVCKGVHLSGHYRGEIAVGLKSAFERAGIRVPVNAEMTADLMRVSEVEDHNGKPVIRSEESAEGLHADYFWAAALALDCIPSRADVEPFIIGKTSRYATARIGLTGARALGLGAPRYYGS